MTLANVKEPNFTSVTNEPLKVKRTSLTSKEALILADIYQEETNIVTWQRDLPASLKNSINNFLISNPTFKSNLTVTPQNVRSCLTKELCYKSPHPQGLSSKESSAEQPELVENIAELVEMFCCLFEISHAGLRLTTLDRAMCPKFHVDRVPCRLVTTYQGIGTEWLHHQAVDHAKLGLGSKGLPDSESGLYQYQNDIQQLNCGDVALLKGETWHKNDGAGLVHRSPALPANENRLLLTLDFAV